tara:strand:- start:41 stop:610 length:570 start_codon:yes stop_codon:yes gene_type:complete
MNQLRMKYLNYLILNCFFIISCQTPQDQKAKKSPPEVAIGSALMEGTSMMTPIIPGELSNQTLWLDYIQAHNDRNLNKIAEINAVDWEGYTADGSVVKGNSSHIEILDNWFKTSSPKWEVKWMIANAAKNKDGVIEQWLTTGNDYTDVDADGNPIFEHNVHDILFVDGKIKKINVYKRAKAEVSAEFSY